MRHVDETGVFRGLVLLCGLVRPHCGVMKDQLDPANLSDDKTDRMIDPPGLWLLLPILLCCALLVRPVFMVSEIARATDNLTISGIGGVTCANDAIEHILVGASTVQSCTGPMLQGFGMVEELCEGLEAFMDKHGFASVQEMVGHSLQYFSTHHHLVDLQQEKRARKEAARRFRDKEWGEGDITTGTDNLTST